MFYYSSETPVSAMSEDSNHLVMSDSQDWTDFSNKIYFSSRCRACCWMVSFVWEICSILGIWQHWMIGVFTHGADWSIRTCSLNMVKVLGGFIEQTLFLYLGIFWCLVTNICNEMFIYFLLFVLFQFWNSSQRNGWRLQSFGDVRFSRWNRFLKQNQPFNSRPHTYF